MVKSWKIIFSWLELLMFLWILWSLWTLDFVSSDRTHYDPWMISKLRPRVNPGRVLRGTIYADV